VSLRLPTGRRNWESRASDAGAGRAVVISTTLKRVTVECEQHIHAYLSQSWAQGPTT
jgi:hypothetical protein